MFIRPSAVGAKREFQRRCSLRPGSVPPDGRDHARNPRGQARHFGSNGAVLDAVLSPRRGSSRTQLSVRVSVLSSSEYVGRHNMMFGGKAGWPGICTA